MLIFFPCCRIFVSALQNTVLNAFRNLLSSSPTSLEIFRQEGIWDLMFSENFFHFASGSDESAVQMFGYSEKSEILSVSRSTGNTAEVNGVNSLQMEVISFVEFAATCSGNTQNMVGSFIPLLFIHLYVCVCVCVYIYTQNIYLNLLE